MWIVNWLLTRFQGLQTLLDTLLAPITNLINNFWNWLTGAVNTGVAVANAFAIAKDLIVSIGAQNFAQLLHNIALQDSTLKVGVEGQTRLTEDTRLSGKIDDTVKASKDEFAAKLLAERLAILHEIGETRHLIDVRTLENRTIIDQIGDALADFRGNFDTWFNAVGDTLTRFAQDPLGFIASVLFETILAILQWEIAVGLARPGLDIGQRPSFGSGQVGNSGDAVTLPPQELFVLSPVKTIKPGGRPFDKNSHPAFDFALSGSEQAFSAINGKITRLQASGDGSGYSLQIDGGKQSVRYVGLVQVFVVQGQTVTTKTTLGMGGASFEGTGKHLHFEVRIGGIAYDPLLVMLKRT